MSRVGKQPVKIQKGVKISLNGRDLKVEGPNGKLNRVLPEGVDVKVEGEQVLVTRSETAGKQASALQGLVRSLVANMVHGCATGFTRELDIVGVGYRAAVKGQTLTLNLGYSHPIDHALPQGISAKVDKNTHIVLTGADKELLGVTASKIRSYRKPEPYQGKGVKYSDERIIRKQGKAAGGGK